MIDPPEEAPERDIDDILADLIDRIGRGEPIDPDDWLGRYPRFRKELEAFFARSALIDERTGSAAPGLEVETISPDEGASGSVDPRLPERLGDYEIVEKIGAGGMGIVYKAYQTELDRYVAIKVIKSGIFASDAELKRFYVEARAAGCLRHPNIVNVHQIGQCEGHHFFSMDYVEGQDLGQVCDGTPVDPRFAAKTLKIIAESIHSAHRQGLIHRDLKPANILIDAEGKPHVTDFGLAKRLDDDAKLTMTGATIGTPSYAAPEAARGDPAGPSADVYSMGAILYALITGEPPFRGKTPLQTLYEVIQRDPEHPTRSNPEADPDLCIIALKCLEKDPRKRYRSAARLADDLGRYLAGKPILARPRSRIRRSLDWLHGIPVIAAFAGKDPTQATRAQTAAHWALLVSTPILLLILGFRTGLFDQSLPQDPMPHEVMVAAAMRGGEYFQLAERLAPRLSARLGRPVRVIETEGSLDNRNRLLAGEAHLGLLQASAVHPDEVAVIAPLYKDTVHVVVRAESGLETLGELRGQKVSVGLPGSGMLASARRLLQHHGMSLDDFISPQVHFTILMKDPSYVGAIITTGLKNEDLISMAHEVSLRFLSLDEISREKMSGMIFQAITIPEGALSGGTTESPIPREDIRTLATPTFLVAQKRSAHLLIEETLREIYEDQEWVDLFDLVPKSRAMEWKMIGFHPVARRFYSQKDSLK